MLQSAKSLSKSRFLLVVLGIVLLGIVVLGALSSQMSAGPSAADAMRASTSAQASVAAATSPRSSVAATSSAAPKPFLTEYQDPQPETSPNGVLTVVSLMWKLGVVVGLIYLVVLGMRYFGAKTRSAVMGDSTMRVLDRLSLGQNRDIFLVEVAELDHAFLIGATANNITVLSEVSDPEVVGQLGARSQASLPSAEPFLNYLKKIGDNAKPIAAEVAATAASHPADLLKPADLRQRIEDHKRRLRESTASLQSTPAVDA